MEVYVVVDALEALAINGLVEEVIGIVDDDVQNVRQEIRIVQDAIEEIDNENIDGKVGTKEI